MAKKKGQITWSDGKTKPKMSSRAGSTTSCDQSINSINNNNNSSEEKAGWLQKWTNYLKGYRQRWFVLDSESVFSYYRSPGDVGQSCRGSIDLQKARIISDKVSNNIVISTQSQSFHLKASNDIDRQKWLQALEYARHKAIKQAESDEDEEANRDPESSRVEVIQDINKDLDRKLVSLRDAVRILGKHSDELIRCVGDSDTDNKTLSERATLVKITTSAVLKAAEEFVDHSDKGAKRLRKVLATEQKEKVVLQEQLEALAKQHAGLERAATISHSNAPISAYSDQDDDFHDALETLSIYNERSSRSNSHEAVDGMNGSHASAPGSSLVPISEGEGRLRRNRIPERPELPINLWSIMKNCIGKDLSKIPMPVNFSEPLSVLQRITEDLEYSQILDSAVGQDPLIQLCHVAAYGVSNYSTTGNRTNKPFNPLLGETYECDRSADKGWRSVAEQVSHHPPAAAHHAEGRGWTMFQDFTMTSRFRGKYLSVIPVGYTHVTFPGTGSNFSYKKITTTVHNIIVGKLWIDNHGEMEIENHATGDRCVVKFFPYSYFSKEVPRKIYGIVKDKTGKPHYVVQGTWDKYVDMLKVTRYNGSGDKLKVETDENPIRIWTCNATYTGSEKMHNFTRFAIELNEAEDGVAPTDSRLRPDQRLMEDGRWDESNKKKQELEEKQRAVRRRREAEAEKTMANGEGYQEYQPVWFTKAEDPLTGALMHIFNGDYWEAKKNSDWTRCPNIY